MSINANRPTITYENIAVFQSNSPAHDTSSNYATGISFVPLAESVEISFSVDEKLVREIGNKQFSEKQSYLAPDVNFSLSKKESFTGLFNQLTGTDTDTNFYVAIKDKKSEDVISGNSFDLDTETDFISVGNCFLNTVEVSQNVNGLMESKYSYVGSNLTAQSGSSVDIPAYSNDFEGMSLGNVNLAGGHADDGRGLSIIGFAGGSNAITETTAGSLGGGSLDLKIADVGTTYGIRFSGFSRTGLYEITGHYRTEGSAKLIVRAMDREVSPVEKLFSGQFLSTSSYSSFSITGNLSGTKNVVEFLLQGSNDNLHKAVVFENIIIQRKDVFQLDAPSLNLTGDQTTGIKAEFFPQSSDQSEFVVPHHKTNVSMQASGQNDNSVFTVLSDSIQSFTLNCPIERKSIYSMGKKHAINRKKIHPNLGSFSVSNIASSFRVDNDSRTRLNDFVGEKFTIQITGSDVEDTFHGVEFEGQLISHTLSSQIGSNMNANFNFTFDLESLKEAKFIQRFKGAALAYSLRSLNSKYISGQPDYVIRVRRSNDDERDFTADEITDGTLLGWVGTLPIHNGFVSIWYDQSGNGKHATQGSEDKQPKIVDGGVLVTSGGNAAIKSTGGSHQHLDFVFNNELSADGQQSLFMVVENDVTAQPNNYPALFRLYSTTTAASTNNGRNRRPYWFIRKNTAVINFSVNSFSGYEDNSKNRHLFSHIMNDDNGGTSTIHRDGAQVDSRSITLDANSNVLNASNNERILEVDRHSTGNLFMSELVYYTSDQTSNRANIDINIKNYYAIT